MSIIFDVDLSMFLYMYVCPPVKVTLASERIFDIEIGPHFAIAPNNCTCIYSKIS